MDYEQARERMVEEQLASRGINDESVLNAFRTVPRHEFIPEARRDQAYADHPIPVGEGQTISQPYMVAAMTQALQLTEEEKVLEVGTGSGYQAAILAELADHVISVERYESLAEQAMERLSTLGYDVNVVVGDGTNGWPAHAPYDGIIVTAAAPHVPQPLREQLAHEGRLVIPVGSKVQQQLIVGVKHGDRVDTEELFGCRFVPLVGEHGWS